MDDLHSTNFLWPTECELLHHFISLQNEGFTWDNSKHGHFHEDFFPPIEIPIVVHTPWVERNIPIPPGIYNEVHRIIRMWVCMNDPTPLTVCVGFVSSKRTR